MSRLTAPPAAWQHEQESVESLTRRAHALIEANSATFSPSKVSRLIRQRLRDIRAGSVIDFDTYFMPHLDLTGETAVYNVMAGVSK